jgi:hypothetical protein
MSRRFASFLALTLLVSASSAPDLRRELEASLDPAEVECLMRAPQDGVRWQWNASYCVGLIVGRLAE